MFAIMSLPVSLGRPLSVLDKMHHLVDYPANQKNTAAHNPLRSSLKRRRLLAEAAQSSTSSASAQGGVITSSSMAQVVSDGNGNMKAAGKADSVAEGGTSSQTQSSTQGYVSLKQETDGSVDYVVNSASAVSAQDSSTGPSKSPPKSEAHVSGESSTTLQGGPDATATHQASATGTLTSSEGINSVIVSQNKPLLST